MPNVSKATTCGLELSFWVFHQTVLRASFWVDPLGTIPLRCTLDEQLGNDVNSCGFAWIKPAVFGSGVFGSPDLCGRGDIGSKCVM